MNISNALTENAIRPFAVGRRNWLFADTTRGARVSATVYSLIETAKANGLEPYQYLRHVLAQIAAADTLEKIEALLPRHVSCGNQGIFLCDLLDFGDSFAKAPAGVVSLIDPQTAVLFIPDSLVPDLLRNWQIPVQPVTSFREVGTPMTWRPMREQAD